MTSEQFSLLPARSDDDATALCRLELAAGSVAQLGETIRAVVGHCMPFEPRPQKLDRIEVGRIAGKEVQLDAALRRGDVVAHQVAAMRLQAIPQDEQRPAPVGEQRREELDHLFLGDRPVVQTEAHPVEMHAGDQRQLMPIEVKLHHRRLAFDCPGPHPGRALRDAGLVDEDDQSSLASGVFFRAGQLRLRHSSMAAASRSKARRSGFWLENPNCPSNRQMWTSLYRTPNSRSIHKRTRLSVHSGVVKPCSSGPSSNATYSRDNSAAPSRAGRPPLLMSRNASIPCASSTSRQRYTVCRGAPTARATSGGVFP